MVRNLSIVLPGSRSSIGTSIHALQEDAIQCCPALIVLKEENNNSTLKGSEKAKPVFDN